MFLIIVGLVGFTTRRKILFSLIIKSIKATSKLEGLYISWLWLQGGGTRWMMFISASVLVRLLSDVHVSEYLQINHVGEILLIRRLSTMLSVLSWSG